MALIRIINRKFITRSYNKKKQKHLKVILLNAVESKNDIQKLEAKIKALTTLLSRL